MLDRGTADHDAADAALQPGGDRRHVAKPAAELDGNRARRVEDRGDGLAVDRTPRQRPVQIDDVQEPRPGFDEAARLRRGVVAVDGRILHPPLQQADALAALEIDRGVEGERARHGFSAAPVRPDLSPVCRRLK